MNVRGFGHTLCFIATTCLFAGCAGPQPLPGAPGLVSEARTTAKHAGRTPSWMLPEAKSEDLLYVANNSSGNVTIYAYPAGNLVGSLKGFSDPYGVCADKAGNVFVTDFGGEIIVEYAHGATKPIETLHDNGTPNSCAVDPLTGDLAVTNNCDGPVGSCSPSGTVLIYKHAEGTAEMLTDKYSSEMLYCTYDASGNLFVDGITTIYDIGFAELRKGSSTFVSLALKLPGHPQAPGGLQWDDAHLAVSTFGGNAIYRYLVSGTRARLDGTTRLRGVLDNHGTLQFLIDGAIVVAPVDYTKNNQDGTVEFFTYPQRGKAVKTITKSLDFPDAVTISRTGA
jgi:hypothetical protein